MRFCTRLAPRPFIQIRKHFVSYCRDYARLCEHWCLVRVAYLIIEIRAYLHVATYSKMRLLKLCTRLGSRPLFQWPQFSCLIIDMLFVLPNIFFYLSGVLSFWLQSLYMACSNLWPKSTNFETLKFRTGLYTARVQVFSSVYQFL